MKDILSEKKKKKKPSAQSQVHNRVNSGLMDAICMGGLEESAPDFQIGMERDSNLEYGHVTGGSAGVLVTESDSFASNGYRGCFKSICKYMNTHGLTVKPYPSIQLNNAPQEGLLIQTGHYEPDRKKVVLYTYGRHPKDILRSFAHEMVHHAQNLRGDNLVFYEGDEVKNNQRLEKIESEAYLKGNIYFRKWTEYFKKGGQKKLNENITDEYIAPNDVDLSGFVPKKRLNPKFWTGDGHLDFRVRIKLLDIAEDFLNYMGVSWVEPEDIVLTGSLAGLNYSEKYSDVDVHIIIDYDDVGDNKELVGNYFYAQKKLWNEEHRDLSIFGYPVEVFVEDYGHPAKGPVYSLMREKWIDKPERAVPELSPETKKSIRGKVSEYTRLIDSLLDEFEHGKSNEYLLRVLGKKTDRLFARIKKERQSGLEKSEFSEGNMIFKSLRRNGYLAKIIDLKRKIYDKNHSLD